MGMGFGLVLAVLVLLVIVGIPMLVCLLIGGPPHGSWKP